MLAGIEVREEDLEPQHGLAFVSVVFRICALVLVALALWQFIDWWMDRPPGNVGMAVLVGDTIRLVVTAALLWAASNLAYLFIKSHYDLRATRILMARQTYMNKQIGIAQSVLPANPTIDHERRGAEPEAAIPDAPPGSPG